MHGEMYLIKLLDESGWMEGNGRLIVEEATI